MKTYAIISTEKGDMKAELYADETPGTVANFVDLAEHGFYDGLTFHRVIPDFVIQGGCPRGDGTGGPGYTIKCETSAPRQRHDRGVLSMAHAGRDTGGSQFFICMNRENTRHLDGVHTCFGQVIEGLDVIDDIRRGDRILSISIVREYAPEAAPQKPKVPARQKPCRDRFISDGSRPHPGRKSPHPAALSEHSERKKPQLPEGNCGYRNGSVRDYFPKAALTLSVARLSSSSGQQSVMRM